MRTPIKDTRSNTAAVSYLESIIEPGSSVDCYNIFAGSVEVELSSQRDVTCYTNSYVVYEFWRCVTEEPHKIFEILTCSDFDFDAPEYYNILQERWFTYKNPFLRSAFFFMLNRCSDTGLISSGELDQTNYTPLAITELKNFRTPDTFSIQFIKSPGEELTDIIDTNTESQFIYIPVGNFSYNLFEDGKSYGPEQTRINNRKLKNILKSNNKVALHYNAHKALPNFFKDYNVTLIDKYGKIQNDIQNSQEVIVANF